jgi:hypothetical protein
VVRKSEHLRGSSTHNGLLSDTLLSESEQSPLRERDGCSSVVVVVVGLPWLE